MSGVNDVLNNMQSSTAIQQAKDRKINGSSNELNQDMFLKLMLEQLKYQDPMKPMDNQQFLAQQAQFTQLSELQKLNDSIAGNNTVMQAVSLIGKEVTLRDPDNAKNTITGVVQEAVFDANGSSIMVNGKSYPLALVQNIRAPQAEDKAPESTPKDEETATATKLSDSLDSFSTNVSKIAQTIEFISSKISEYIK